VRACPTGARHFGDLGDPESAVSQLVAERGGFDLLAELGYKPVNKYLPPRDRRDQTAASASAAWAGASKQAVEVEGGAAERLFAWIDQLLSR
jgi:sulfite dehydrogenase (quinone) subunit SoeB